MRFFLICNEKTALFGHRAVLPALFVFAHRALAALDIFFLAAAESLRRLSLPFLALLCPPLKLPPSRAEMALVIRALSCFNALMILAVSIEIWIIQK